ncbi:DUF4936 family protein [Caldimonas thermodepolymerans]|jgi:hypothetical protein|uniref:DUF4936 domain-containing protein n=1 Tax=Caldimonas thermodepolymerans TaxID=215580 RepID=A0A2S5T6T2_9BURK|nr:DUF4936 family protein [Caldimonas thermodepolymerans]PPE70642.1 DUF4936 domain-containing protein [Caldimonas thermodepolymerans]QPC29978.1 DUF4936 family protein [Caldimonas thermodepolymerans]RDH97596.1 uncharacterized protein DUF4936 [Caldimonas thermodepolymerans]TCP10009.1 uncharacterized protein DUF4936 [Caldimonas thermodepolymerans]UZG42720.1 DUF4936 family protein [Caldimonas thermodepolymerans]
MRALFIYYRIASADAGAARPAVEAMHAALRRRHPELEAALWRRPQEKDGVQTWMEIYAHPQGVSEALEAEIEEAARTLSPWLQGARHVEVFVPCV